MVTKTQEERLARWFSQKCEYRASDIRWSVVSWSSNV